MDVTNFCGFSLPEDFLIGTANSAFQSEGACDRDGKSESVMEHFAKEYAGQIPPRMKSTDPQKVSDADKFTAETNEEGCFFYDHFEEYIEDMKKTGQNTFRMSLAWPRIIPTGVGEVNPKGIEHYNKVIDKLIACGIEPFVDLYHWDMPYCLYEQGGFENPAFPEWFEAYAKVCFENFGDRVKYWSTFNESQVAVGTGYMLGGFPPFVWDLKRGTQAGHYVLLAHFRAVRLYKSMNLGGKIGAVNCILNMTPMTTSEEDVDAIRRQFDRYFNWWTEPMLRGTYPQRLIRECPKIRETLPANYQQELDEWFVPMDFIGVNYYMTKQGSYNPNGIVKCTVADNYYAAPGQKFASYPPGMLDILQYISTLYPGVDIYITENGCAIPNTRKEETELHDEERIVYIREHLRMVARAIKAGIPVKGYYYWNDADSYEELSGYDLTFGLTWVDRESGKRVWKDSRYYFSEICKTHRIN